jgi:hypothetical protein
MKSKKLISLLFVLVLSIQVLPLQQIAKWLSSGQLTEEIAHGINSVKAKSTNDEVHPPFEFHAYGAGIHSLFTADLSNHLLAEDLYVRHADDILSPPPNC